MIDTYCLFDKVFICNDLEIAFLDFQIKPDLEHHHNIRGFADIQLKYRNKEEKEIFPIFLSNNELFLQIDTHDILIPIHVFLDACIDDEKIVTIRTCFAKECHAKNNELIVLNGGLVTTCFNHIENLFFEKYNANNTCSVCGEESDVFFTNYNGENRTDLCEKHFSLSTSEEIYHSIYKYSF